MSRLDETITLDTSTRYANPQQVGQILPDAYGDLRYGGEGGLMECVYIDTVNRVHLCANHAVESIDQVYDRDQNLLTTPGDYTATLSGNYEAQGTIAYVTVSVNVIPPIYWRGKGRLDGATLITNPISAWEDFFETRAGWTAADFDTTMLEAARATCTAQSYTFALRIGEERLVKDWLNEWCADIFADHWLDRLDRLVVKVETGSWNYERDIVAHVVADRDVVDGQDGVEMTADIENLVNFMRQYHLYHYRRMDYSSAISNESAASEGIFGDRIRTANYPTVRSTTHLNALATVLLNLFDGRDPPKAAMVKFSTHGMKYCHLTRGDIIGFSWDRGPARAGDYYRNRLLKILNLEMALPVGPIRIEALDTGVQITADYYYDADGGPDSGYFNADYCFGGEDDLSIKP